MFFMPSKSIQTAMIVIVGIQKNSDNIPIKILISYPSQDFLSLSKIKAKNLNQTLITWERSRVLWKQTKTFAEWNSGNTFTRRAFN